MFTCECGKSYEKQSSLNSHARFCSEYIKVKQPSIYKVEDNTYKCECGKIFDNYQGLNGHFAYCQIHRNGKAPTKKGGGWAGWCKGLTKETSDSLKRASEKLKIKPKRPGTPHTIESRKNLSEKRTLFLENNKDAGVKWYEVSNGTSLIKVQGTWERDVAEWLNQQGVNWNRERIKYDECRTYTPDFKIEEFDFYIEVKGWLKDRDVIKMKKVIDQTSIKIKLLDKSSYNKVLKDSTFTIFDLPDFL